MQNSAVAVSTVQFERLESISIDVRAAYPPNADDKHHLAWEHRPPSSAFTESRRVVCQGDPKQRGVWQERENTKGTACEPASASASFHFGTAFG